MSAEPTIVCPSCQTEIKLTESLAAPLIESTKKQFEKRLADQETRIQQKEATLREGEEALAKAKESLETEVAERLQKERAAIASVEAKKARAALSLDLEQKAKEIADLNEVLKSRDEKLAEAQKAQVDLLRKQRELDDAKRELELTVEKRVQDGLGQARDQAKKEAEEGLRLRVAEKEEVIAAMQRQIEELKRKAEQGSQQLQGEVLELELENLLRGSQQSHRRTNSPPGRDLRRFPRFCTTRRCRFTVFVRHDEHDVRATFRSNGRRRSCRHQHRAHQQPPRERDPNGLPHRMFAACLRVRWREHLHHRG